MRMRISLKHQTEPNKPSMLTLGLTKDSFLLHNIYNNYVFVRAKNQKQGAGLWLSGTNYLNTVCTKDAACREFSIGSVVSFIQDTLPE